MPTIVPGYLHLDLSKHVMRNISRFRLRAHPLKVEAAAWLEDGSCVCDQYPGEDEHVQNEVHALLFCQDHRVCELKNIFLFTPFFEDFLAAQPFLLQQVNNQLVHDFLSQQNTRLFWRSPSHGAQPLGLSSSHQSLHQCAQAHPAHPPPPELARHLRLTNQAALRCQGMGRGGGGAAGRTVKTKVIHTSVRRPAQPTPRPHNLHSDPDLQIR